MMEAVSRLRAIPGIGVDILGDAADRRADPDMLRLENLDTDIRPLPSAITATAEAAERDSSNSYLPFQGAHTLRQAVSAHVDRLSGQSYDPLTQCVITAGGLNGIFNTLLATVEPGAEVVLADPIYAGLVNRVHLAGGVPRFVSCTPTPQGWQTDPEELAAAVTEKTAAVLMMSPAMPTGAVLSEEHWLPLTEALHRHDAWLIYDAAMERIRFDDVPVVHPAAVPGLAERTIIVGSASKELRMIGWRVGWVLGPTPIMRDINLVGLTNVVTQVGIAQEAVTRALTAPDADSDVAAAVHTWKERSELIVRELHEYPVIPPHGGWSVLINTAQMGVSPERASELLFESGQVAATPMTGWGPSGGDYLRLVFANESVERLSDIRDRFQRAFG